MRALLAAIRADWRAGGNMIEGEWRFMCAVWLGVVALMIGGM